MKTNWPAYRLAYVLLVSIALLAGPMSASAGTTPPVVRVDAQVTARGVRIDAQAPAPFEYTTVQPSENLLVVNLPGLSTTDPASARVLMSDIVSSYRVLRNANGVKLEILLRHPADARFERRGPDQLSVIFEPKAASTTKNTKPGESHAASSTAVATQIANVQVGREGQEASVRVQGNGRLIYRATRVEDPERLVLDFSGAHVALSHSSIPSVIEPVRRVRVSQFQSDVARVVIDLERAARYDVRAEGQSLTVVFGAPAAASTAKPATKPAVPAQKVSATRIPTRPSISLIKVSGMPLPAALTQSATALASPAQNSSRDSVVTPKNQPQAPAQDPAQAPTPAPAKKYTGEPISVNLKDVDLKDFFRLIHEISGLNVVLDPAVKGTVTLVLDEVPWDQALDIVMRNNGLDKQIDGNVLRIATQDTMKKEAETKRDLAKAQAEAVDQVTATRVLSYAKATAMRDTLKRFLSARGEILADERSNTLIIRDIPSVLPAIDNLLRQLDRKGQQVEIEARVVAASRSFARDIGTQFGFGTTTTSGRSIFGGNTQVGTSQFNPATPGGPGFPSPPLVVAGTNALPLVTNLAAGAPTSGFGFIHRSPNFAVDLFISAAEAKGVGKLLSKPRVITQNNEKATVKQGTKIPVQTTINNTISVQFIDAVLKLEVTPQITAEGTVFMEVVVENTQIDAGIPRVQGIPALDTESAETKVLINDGGTVVIGGVIISSQRTDVAQVPLIGSIPLIGNLFKRTTVNVQSQELLFFLTPRIVPG